jgi:predicted nucleic acid-binding protein
LSICLDAWAILRWLEGVEPAASRVDTALEARPVMSWINLGEVYDVVHRAGGPEYADEVASDLQTRLALDQATPERVLAAAAIKARHPMALGDAFAVATSLAHEAVLLTGDPELLEREPLCLVEDLR